METNNTQLPSFYYDLQSLAPLKKAASESPEDLETLRNVAKQFESMFMQMVLKSMRSASQGESLFDSKQSLFYRDMFDKELSVKLSSSGGMGLADLLVEQLSRPSIPSRPDPFAVDKNDTDSYNGMPLTGRSSRSQSGDSYPVTPQAVRVPNDLIPRHVIPVPATIVSDSMVSTPAVSIPALAPVSSGSAANERSDFVKETEPNRSKSISEKRGIWESPAEFVRDIWPHAVNAAKQLGVDPKVLVAQSALETGWGSKLPQHPDGRSSFNLFGIKAGESWQGDRVRVSTLEFEGDRFVSEKSAFRSYPSVADAMSDYVDFLKSRARYAGALENAADPEKYSRALQDAGYATDPVYADKILRVMDSAPIADGLASLSVTQTETVG